MLYIRNNINVLFYLFNPMPSDTDTDTDTDPNRISIIYFLAQQIREESFSSYRSETDAETSLAGSPRPETPAFPITPRTPYGLNGGGLSSPALPPKSPNTVR